MSIPKNKMSPLYYTYIPLSSLPRANSPPDQKGAQLNLLAGRLEIHSHFITAKHFQMTIQQVCFTDLSASTDLLNKSVCFVLICAGLHH